METETKADDEEPATNEDADEIDIDEIDDDDDDDDEDDAGDEVNDEKPKAKATTGGTWYR
jgi:hypothetical protein